MKINMNSNEKILSVLDKLKEEWDITPRKPFVDRSSIHWRFVKAGITHIQYIIWLNELPLDFFQLNNILQILKQEKIIENNIFTEDVLEIEFPLNFEEKYNSYRESLSQKKTEKSSDSKQEINSILLVAPDHGKFNYLWVIINDDYEHKLKVDVKNKHNPSEESYAKKLWRLAEQKEITYDKAFYDYVSYSLYLRKEFKNKFKKTRIFKEFSGKISAMEGITISKTSLGLLNKPERGYFPTF